ncbi:class I SAM-dependent methyltransferase [Sulfuricurvum sp.]|uniref:class I SAM-dependent methyltransferase n=1 Tax=Sulfuricurvum sp. TaxID=2025608 RepID=UPI003564153D
MSETYQQYWKDRSWSCIREGIKTVDNYAMKCFLMETKPKMLLEIGCGLGRFLPLYKDVDQVFATDLVDERITHCKTLGFDNYKFEVLDISKQTLPFAFDTIVSTQVLLHIPPKHIANAIKNMVDMTNDNGHWWHCTNYAPVKLSAPDADYSPELPTANSFSHPLPELFENAGMKVISMENIQFFNGAVNTIFVCKKEV